MLSGITCVKRMASMLAVDTNVLVRLTIRDDAPQLAAATAYIANGAWVSHVVVCEAIWVLASFYQFTRAQQREFVAKLLTNGLLLIQDADVVASALQHFQRDAKVSFSDCMILELARKSGHTPLGTFDGELSKLDGAEKLVAR